MAYTFTDDGFEVGDTRYTAEGMVKNKLLIKAVTRYGIYVTDVKVKNISRVINKDGKIKLATHLVDVLGISGVEFHLNEYRNKK